MPPFSSLGEKLTAGVKKAQQEILKATNTASQAVGAAVQAGVKTCDEKGGGNVSDRQEFRVSPSDLNPQPNYPIEIWGTHNFNFSFTYESDGHQHSGKLVASAVRSSNGGGNTSRSNIPIRCRWKRRIGDRLVPVHNVNSNYYQVSADDIGAKIRVEATPIDHSFTGVAYGELGPFEMDPGTRKNLDNYLANGSTRFPVRMNARESGFGKSDDDDLVLHVTCDEITLLKPAPMNDGYTYQWKGRYGAEYPRVVLSAQESTAFQLILDSEPDSVFSLNAITRNQRDLIALTIRCFHARQYISTTAVVEQLIHPNSDEYGDSNGSTSLDLLVVLERLSSDLYQSVQKQEMLLRERDRAVTEKDSLEQEINATIQAYQELLLDYQNPEEDLMRSSRSHKRNGGGGLATTSSDVTSRAAYVAEVENKLRDAQLQSSKFQEELALVRKDYRALQNRVKDTPRSNGAGDDLLTSTNTIAIQEANKEIFALQQKVRELRRERDDLLTKNEQHEEYVTKLSSELSKARALVSDTQSLLSSKEHMDVQNRELKKLAQSLDEMTSINNTLESRNKVLEKDNRELSENFLYIKEKYDTIKKKNENKETDSQASLATLRKTEQLLTSSKTETDELRRKLKTLEDQLSDRHSALDASVTSKNRLEKKNDSLSKDLEKSRSTLNSTTKKLTEAKAATHKLTESNQKLSDEKKQLEMELTHIRKLFEDQTVELKSLTNTQSMTVLSEESRISSEGNLAEQLKIKQAEIEKLLSENSTLKSRVRKLAAAS